MKKMGVPSTVSIISDIASINWGRNVGYETNLIDVDEEIKTISATEIRNMLKNDIASWEELVCDGVVEFIKKSGI